MTVVSARSVHDHVISLWKLVPAYIVAQVLGAILATLL
jgi:glycerol uptake facilitator-like aquaporin